MRWYKSVIFRNLIIEHMFSGVGFESKDMGQLLWKIWVFRWEVAGQLKKICWMVRSVVVLQLGHGIMLSGLMYCCFVNLVCPSRSLSIFTWSLRVIISCFMFFK